MSNAHAQTQTLLTSYLPHEVEAREREKIISRLCFKNGILAKLQEVAQTPEITAWTFWYRHWPCRAICYFLSSWASRNRREWKQYWEIEKKLYALYPTGHFIHERGKTNPGTICQLQDTLSKNWIVRNSWIHRRRAGILKKLWSGNLTIHVWIMERRTKNQDMPCFKSEIFDRLNICIISKQLHLHLTITEQDEDY